jgi:hypothetical protein
MMDEYMNRIQGYNRFFQATVLSAAVLIFAWKYSNDNGTASYTKDDNKNNRPTIEAILNEEEKLSVPSNILNSGNKKRSGDKFDMCAQKVVHDKKGAYDRQFAYARRFGL